MCMCINVLVCSLWGHLGFNIYWMLWGHLGFNIYWMLANNSSSSLLTWSLDHANWTKLDWTKNLNLLGKGKGLKWQIGSIEKSTGWTYQINLWVVTCHFANYVVGYELVNWKNRYHCHSELNLKDNSMNRFHLNCSAQKILFVTHPISL